MNATADPNEVIAFGLTRAQIDDYAANIKAYYDAHPDEAAALKAENERRYAACSYWHGEGVVMCTKCGWSPP